MTAVLFWLLGRDDGEQLWQYSPGSTYQQASVSPPICVRVCVCARPLPGLGWLSVRVKLDIPLNDGCIFIKLGFDSLPFKGDGAKKEHISALLVWHYLTVCKRTDLHGDIWFYWIWFAACGILCLCFCLAHCLHCI